jgi:hypothetical protein
MEKLTMKERVLRFVESKGTAKFAEIQKFIVDINYGKGAYESQKDYEGKKRFRGYYCAAFRTGGRGRWGYTPVGYFLKGDNRLEKISTGVYKTVRS